MPGLCPSLIVVVGALLNGPQFLKPFSEKKTVMPGLFASWVHGTAGQPERGFNVSRAGILAGFKDRYSDGDIVDLGDWAGLAISRLGIAARFAVFDIGVGDLPKSGGAWIHYPIPTPVIVEGKRARFVKLLIRHETPSPMHMAIVSVYVHDGETRVLTVDNVVPNSPDPLVLDIPGNREVLWGVVVSVRINANNSKNNFMDINAVGVDFMIP
jgi:hypothetical protein